MKTSLGVRMKRYESQSRVYLEAKLPVIIRIDGKGFSKYTKGFKKPFDKIFMETMFETTKFLCSNVQNCQVAYTQSDEITLLLVDYINDKTDSWFKNNLQKLCSVSSSMATLAFNKSFIKNVESYHKKQLISDEEYQFYKTKYHLAMFDSRAFTLPKEEVVNCFIWRQEDCIRNSIQMLGRANFSHKKLDGLNTLEIKNLLKDELNIDWEELSPYSKRGAIIYKHEFFNTETNTIRKKWMLLDDTPVFSKQKDYINNYVLRSANVEL